MVKFNYFRIATMLCSALSTGTTLDMSIEKIANAYQILSPLYKHLSIAHGAALAESHRLANYYDFGQIENSTKKRWLAPGDGPIRLVHALWTLVNHNFLPSTNLSYPAAHIQPSTVGHIIVFLEKLRLGFKKPDAQILEKAIVEEPSFATSIHNTDSEKEQIDNRYQHEIDNLQFRKKFDLDKTIDSQLQQIKAEHSSELSKRDTSRLFKSLIHTKKKSQLEEELKPLEKLTGHALQKEKKRIRQIKDKLESLTTKPVTGDCNRVRDLAQAILDSADPSPYYPPYLTYAILQAFLYKKAKGIEDIIIYYRTIEEELGRHIYYPLVKNAQKLLRLSFYKQMLPSLTSEIKNCFTSKPTQFLSAILDKGYEQFLYAQIMNQFYKGSLPKKPELAKIQFQGFMYPDCVETTLRYLCNIHFYNPESGTIAIPTNILDKIDPQLKTYYHQDCDKQVTSVDLPELHQRWADMLSNRYGIIYKSMHYYSDNGKPITCSPPEGVDGFIRLPKETRKLCQFHKDYLDRIIIGNHTYMLVNRDNIQLFKVAPTLRNIIVVLNQLLGLNLLNSNNDFLKPDFDTTYFPQLCKLIKPLNMLDMKPSDILTLDKKDYSPQGLILRGNNTELSMLMNHAEFTVHEKQQNICPCSSLILDSLCKSIDSDEHDHLIHLYSLVAENSDNLPLNLRYPLLFAFNLQHPEEKISILKKYLQPQILAQFEPTLKERILSAATKIMASLPITIEWTHQERCIAELNPESLKIPTITSILQYWKKIGYERLEACDLDFTPYLFAALVRKGKDYEDGIKVARKYLTKVVPNIDPGTELLVKESALNLYYSLAQKGLVQQEALEATKVLPNAQISKNILGLFKN